MTVDVGPVNNQPLVSPGTSINYVKFMCDI